MSGMEYKIIRTKNFVQGQDCPGDFDNLEFLVRDAIAEGWQPTGGVMHKANTDCLAQAMIRYPRETWTAKPHRDRDDDK